MCNKVLHQYYPKCVQNSQKLHSVEVITRLDTGEYRVSVQYVRVKVASVIPMFRSRKGLSNIQQNYLERREIHLLHLTKGSYSSLR